MKQRPTQAAWLSDKCTVRWYNQVTGNHCSWSKMRQTHLQRAVVQHLAVGQQQQVIKHVENLRRRLQQADNGCQVQRMRHLQASSRGTHQSAGLQGVHTTADWGVQG